MLLEIGPKVHIASDTEVSPVLLLDGSHMGIITLIAQLTIFVAGSVASHARCIVPPIIGGITVSITGPRSLRLRCMLEVRRVKLSNLRARRTTSGQAYPSINRKVRVLVTAGRGPIVVLADLDVNFVAGVTGLAPGCTPSIPYSHSCSANQTSRSCAPRRG
jgi:hypothetical protein